LRSEDQSSLAGRTRFILTLFLNGAQAR